MSTHTDAAISPAEAVVKGSTTRKTLEELIAEQGVTQSATFERLYRSGEQLWADDAEVAAFLEHVQSIRQEKN